ncbi:MAG: phosphoribosylaminoimidazolesuccinocarboxamide synthase [Candidatus Bathyarchaeota archaeon]|nr:phosphoribosylaminoimidazolesuccinocarboxamide synthase [Candidatus Bathyarchaeota archaeon]
MGSVKDLKVISNPTVDVMGVGRFEFSDRYSVFDWGKMPDLIEGKGEALCVMGAYCFEQLEEKSICTHYKGLVTKDGKTVKFDELKEPSGVMEVNIVNVHKPQPRLQEGKLCYDYSIYKQDMKNCLIPLEIIYRNGLPEGSSVFRRLKQGKTTYQDLGLDHYPEPGERFSTPIFDVSTKLEETDRYISWNEAAQIAGLTNIDVEAIKVVLTKVNQTITELASKAGLINEDGKIELAFDVDRRLMVVDVVGTLDECRFTADGLHVSKEIARKFYKSTQWYEDAEQAKKDAQEQGRQDWKSLCKTQPPKLPVELKTVISQMYMAAANEMTGRRFFEAPKLVEVVKKYKDYMGEQQ